MRLSVTEDVALPRAQLFARVSDIDNLLVAGTPRGAYVERQGAPGPMVVGTAWNAELSYRGLRRPACFSVAELNPPQSFVLAGGTESVTLHLDLSLNALTPDRTRLRLVTEMRPRNVRGRVLVQSTRLMKSTLHARFKDRVRGFLRRIEAEAA